MTAPSVRETGDTPDRNGWYASRHNAYQAGEEAVPDLLCGIGKLIGFVAPSLAKPV